MTLLNLMGVTLVVLLMVWAEWRCFEDKTRRERAALIGFATAGWLTAVLVILFPNLPGPIELFNRVCKPLTDGVR
ncbi:hypothetical protein FPL14_24765 [Cohnella cholangitidis]|uniref:Uncharacterized protein n=1 Tax=Cohnella cholangitidis TaxID=2598458 RepID=A0A7G5C491_9BACL|nr:hypothetical protein FPL14_24765 [Cohnella cholangitidis]